eukprot:887129-Pleurochrysis_carterae.AAC.1
MPKSARREADRSHVQRFDVKPDGKRQGQKDEESWAKTQEKCGKNTSKVGQTRNMGQKARNMG